MPAVPFIVPAITGGISAYSGIKNARAAGRQNKLMEQAQGEQITSLRQGRQAGQGLLQMGMPATQQALNYFSTLLRGNRAAMQMATAGPAAQLTDVYRGAERGLERQGVRGGERATALAELSRDRANSIAQLTTGQQPAAAQMLAQYGEGATGQGVNALTGAASGFGGLAGQSGRQGQAFGQQASGDFAGLGKSIGEILRIWQQRQQGAPA